MGFEVGRVSRGSPRSESLDCLRLKLKALRRSLNMDMLEFPELVVEACEELPESVFGSQAFSISPSP